MVTVGIDEVGRGSWAGPLVASAVILRRRIPGLTDSKQLSRRQRERLAEAIEKQAVAIGIGWVEPAMIDEIGLTKAVGLAMRLALEDISEPYDQVIIDGNHNYLPDIPGTKAIVKADASIAAVSAASITAKVVRDKYMRDMAIKLPHYGFDRHVGYGTALHLERLRLHGVSPLHRLSYRPVAALIQ